VIWQGGLRINQANPGSVIGPSQYLAATVGSDDRRAITVELDHAREAYQVLTTGVQKVDFDSYTISGQWRERITRNGLLIVGLSYYTNPNYNNASLNLGWRWSFR
jgi:YaiO family outer membrane protein